MDKLGANFSQSVDSIREKLKALPLITQLPIGAEKDFEGVIDLVNMEKFIWSKQNLDGRNFSRTHLSESGDGLMWAEAMEARISLVEQLADLDEVIADHVLRDTDLMEIPICDIQSALKQVTLNQKAIPILCGSSYKNKGVQQLLDAVIDYLPDPTEIKHEFVDYYKGNLCALAFKIVHDKRRGPLTFLRLYEGHLKSGATIYNINRGCSEKTGRLLQLYADEYKELTGIDAGNIVAVAGLKEVKLQNMVVH